MSPLHIARTSANGSAAFFDSCDAIGRKSLRRATKTLVIEDPGAHATYTKRPLTRSPQQKARLWLADAKASPNHSQAPRQKLPAKTPLV